jgi:predicted transcriptional regulator
MAHLARISDPSTSHLAASKAPRELHWDKITKALYEFGPMGVHGIALVADLDPAQVFRRMKELETYGVICLTGDKVNSPTRLEREWRLVEPC